MGMKAEFEYREGHFGLNFDPTHVRPRVQSLPVAGFNPDSALRFYWDPGALERSQHEFVYVVIDDLDWLNEDDLAALQDAPLPRIDCPAAGFEDAALVDLLRWAKATYPGREGALAPRREYLALVEDQVRKQGAEGLAESITEPTLIQASA
jgi:hypothetical protein